eukprot:TRINITY_DN7072_c1_g1_i1.p1 TRINITY_DN7072_c1_g1~~TRINITY_DN7072_c1_g1_i1.p1  ORF type:complete len:641 (+),score=65.24 TRINITY_DN7072_c1_g1_i1:175-2097(+)
MTPIQRKRKGGAVGASKVKTVILAAAGLLVTAGVWLQHSQLSQIRGISSASVEHTSVQSVLDHQTPTPTEVSVLPEVCELGTKHTESNPIQWPTHDTTPLKKMGKTVQNNFLGCYNDLTREAVRAPTALPAVYNALKDEAEDVARRTRSGSVVVVWVSEKFMPPQKPGKNVRGETVEASSRGRDNSYYIEKYKAVWTKTFTVNGVTYNAMLADKTALVVCMWERLHMAKYLCRGGAEPAAFVPIHFCLCRHCKDDLTPLPSQDAFPKRLSKNTTKPNNRIKFDFEIYRKTNQKQARKCIEAHSAPWLAPKEDVTFPYEGLHANLPKLLKTQADGNNVVSVFIFNSFWVDHLHNIVHSMVANAAMRNYIVATLDCASLQLCIANRLPCFNAVKYAESEDDMKEGGSGFKKGFNRKVTEELSWIKPRLALKVLSLGYNFLMVDMDMSFWNNPLPDVLKKNVDFSHQCDTPNRFSVNTGFYLLRTDGNAARLFESILMFPPPSISDQNALKLSLKYDHTHGTSNTCLDKWLYNMKCNYKVPSSEHRSDTGQRTFKWKPQQRNRDKFDWYIFHATCLDGAISKINWLRASNAWFLDDLDNVTKASGGYCMTTPTNAVLTGLTTQTKHSPRYPTSLEESFYHERH